MAPNDKPKRIVVGITGASGAAYAVRVVELLAEAEVEVHVACSDLGKRLLAEELARAGERRRGAALVDLLPEVAGLVRGLGVHGLLLLVPTVGLAAVAGLAHGVLELVGLLLRASVQCSSMWCD